MKDLEKKKNFYEENQDNNIDNDKIESKAAKKGKSKKQAGFFARLADSFARELKNGFLGFIFAELYVVLNDKWRAGAIYQFFHRNKNKVRARARLGNSYETSLTRNIITRLGRVLLQTYVRVYGVATFAFGFATIAMAALKNALSSISEEEFRSRLIIGIVIALFSLPLTISKNKMGEALLNGKISGFILHQVLSIEETKLEADDSASGGSYLVAFEVAMLLGFTTVVIDPIVILSVLFLVTAFSVIMCFPELGIMSVMLVTPFANIFENPSLAILTVILFTLISYISKFIRGKRIMRFELIDICVLGYGALMLLGGIFAHGGNASLFRALMYCGFLSMYFLIVNSYIRKTWIYRGIKLMVVTTAIIAVLGVLDGGTVNPSIIDLSQFSDLAARVNAFFGNPNMLGAYLVIVFPFSVAQISSAKNNASRAIYVLSLLSILVCIILTGSRGAWLGFLIALAVLLIVSDFRNIWFVLIGGASIPTFLYLVPSVRNRFMSIFNAIFNFTNADTSVKFRLKIWEGVWKMINDNLLTGIGVGESAFAEVYSQYAVSGTENVMHSHNMLLQILTELGLLGLIVFLAVALMFTQKCFSSIKARSKTSKSRLMIAAGYSSLCGALVMGLTDHIFYNYRVFLVFWIVLGLTVALTKINEREELKTREALRVNGNSRSADIDINVEG